MKENRTVIGHDLLFEECVKPSRRPGNTEVASNSVGGFLDKVWNYLEKRSHTSISLSLSVMRRNSVLLIK